MRKNITIFTLALFLSLVLVSASAYSSNILPDSSVTVNTYTGNLTNLSEMQDVNIPAPSDEDVLTYDGDNNQWISKSITSIMNFLMGIDSLNNDNDLLIKNGSNYLGYDSAVLDTIIEDIGDSRYYSNTNPNSYYNSTTLTSNSQLENGNNYWNDTFATFNKTYADTIYAPIGATGNPFDQTLNTTSNVTFVNVTANTYFGDGSQLTGISAGGGTVDGNGTANYLPRYFNASYLMNSVVYDDGSGNVGIGTASPQTPLHVLGTSGITISGVGSNDDVMLLQFTETTNYDEFSLKGDFSGVGGENKIKFTTDLSGGDILTMKGDGKVGIGTTAPKNKLDIAGAMVIGSSYGGTNTAPIDGLLVEGNVGIGITTPGAKLEIKSPNNSAGSTTSFAIEDYGTTNKFFNVRSANNGGNNVFGSFDIRPPGTEQDASSITAYSSFNANNAGLLSIGINGDTSNANSMGIAGNKAFIRYAKNGAGVQPPLTFISGLLEVMRLDTDGNLGIGTTVPKNKLDIAGAMVIGSSYGGTNTAPIDGLLVEGNVGIGTTSPNYDLEVIGSFRADAFRMNETAHTVFVGDDAGGTGTYSTAIGEHAGEGNTGNYQTASGYLAGYQNTGAYQTASGYYAGRQNTGASQTASGYSAGYQNTGAGQTASGFYAGYANTGDLQTASGFYAGYLNTGDYVIGLGYESTYLNNASNVVAIGYQAGESNQVANQFIIQQTNINAVPLIQGDFSSGNVGIGTTSPQNKLNIIGDFNVTSTAYFGGNLTTANGGKLWSNSTCTFLSSPDGSSILEVCNN